MDSQIRPLRKRFSDWLRRRETYWLMNKVPCTRTYYKIGEITVSDIRKNLRAKVDYWTDEKFRGRGIMTNELRRVCYKIVEKYNLQRVHALVAPDNIGSIKVLEKLGFKKEGLLRRYKYKGDLLMYARITDDFKEEMDMVKKWEEEAKVKT